MIDRFFGRIFFSLVTLIFYQPQSLAKYKNIYYGILYAISFLEGCSLYINKRQ